METAIKICTEKNCIEEMGKQINAVLNVCYACRFEQITIQKALEVLSSVCPRHTTITNCHFQG